MRYAAMPDTLRQEVDFPALDTGVDRRAYSSDMGDHALDTAENVWWEQGCLRTRPSVRLKSRFARHASTPVPAGEWEESSSATWWTETYTEEGVSYVTAFQLNALGQRTATLPKLSAAYAVITAWGGGWLAIADTGVFRLNSLTGSWTDVSADVYVPTVMREGKGCLPAEPKPADGEAYEDYNSLTDRFAATYTTDGLSSRFYLPVAGLNSGAVTAVLVNGAGQKVTYTAASGATDSGTVDGRLMRVNRTGGYIQFLDETGAESPLPAGGRDNNLTVTAAKSGVGGGSLVKGMRWGRWLKADEHRAVLMLTGNPDDPSLVCWLQETDRLYLPPGQSAHIGDEHSGVTAIVSVRDRLLLFKPQGMYLMTVSPAEGADRERFRVTLYPSGTGCGCPATIQTREDQVIWLDPEGRVRRLTGSQVAGRQAPDLLSEPVADALQQMTAFTLNNAQAAWWRGRYLLRFEREIWALTPHADKPVWYHWTLNEGLEPAAWASSGDRVELLCRETDGEDPIWVVYHLSADNAGQDRLWIGGEITETDIPYALSTKLWDGELPHRRYRLEGLRVEGALPRHPLTLTLRTEGGIADRLRLTAAQMRGDHLPLRLTRFRWLGVDLQGEGFFCWKRLRLCRRLYQGGRE